MGLRILDPAKRCCVQPQPSREQMAEREADPLPPFRTNQIPWHVVFSLGNLSLSPIVANSPEPV